MKLIDGKSISLAVKQAVADEVETLSGRKPALAVIIVGNNQASRVYVNNKKKACEFCGFTSVEKAMPEETTQEELLAVIDELNRDDEIDGILCQLPLPSQIDEDVIVSAISPEKDVDGFHPVNTGRLYMGLDCFLPCTPAGIMEMLRYEGIEVAGRNCVVIGRSNIVGKPVAQLLLAQNGTVTICHSRTKNLAEITSKADILVAAVGRPAFVTADMVGEGAVVIDVGINRNAEGKLCGDVDFDAVAPKCSAITPVPGGVGPMTIAMLMKNTLQSYKKKMGLL